MRTITKENREIGERIRDERKKNKISLKDLGVKVGLSESTVSRYEKGEIQSLDIEKLKDFAIALHTTPEHLLGWDSQEVQNQADDVLSNTYKIIDKINKLSMPDKETIMRMLDLMSSNKESK